MQRPPHSNTTSTHTRPNSTFSLRGGLVTPTSGATASQRFDDADVVDRVHQVRDSVAGVMKITPGQKKGEFHLGFVGTAWCAVANRTFVSAFHVFNGGQPRQKADRFYLFAVPDNGPQAYPMAVTAFHLEDRDRDIAVFDVSKTNLPNFEVPGLSVRLDEVPEGTRVVTYGFPSPIVAGANLSPDGEFLGSGKFFLIGHANEGIVAARFGVPGSTAYQFNVNWHHGESGGPVTSVQDGCVFAMMQSYRNIESPHGVVAGPHQGHGLQVAATTLRKLGATVL